MAGFTFCCLHQISVAALWLYFMRYKMASLHLFASLIFQKVKVTNSCVCFCL